uniref:Guanine nucleotide-binding protein subunit gamma n=3 Tax=Passeriformes TaxID=9126 RepID=A0A8C3N9U0_GEOPR
APARTERRCKALRAAASSGVRPRAGAVRGDCGRSGPGPSPGRRDLSRAEPSRARRNRAACPLHPLRLPRGSGMSSGGSLSTLQRLVEQLKLEAAVERIKVSQAAAELQQYCMQNACKDALLVGVPAGSNPFREPRSCALL